MDYALYKKIIHNATSLKSIVESKVACKMPYFECVKFSSSRCLPISTYQGPTRLKYIFDAFVIQLEAYMMKIICD